MPRVIAIVGLLLAACGAPGPAPAVGAGSGGIELGTSGSSGSTTDPADTFDPPLPTAFDLGAADDGGEAGCQKIDFLFVIDNSSSMGKHQQALIDSFDDFMATIVGTVQAQDYHVMVVDSDAGDDIERACEPCPAAESGLCGDWCTAKATLDLSCETALGAGEVAPYNQDASNRICGVPGERRYLTSASAPAELTELFSCIGNVGINGSSAELPLSAMVEAVTTQSAPGGCNDGFLRDDAVLVVTVITDDYPVPHSADDANDNGSPGAWYDAVVGAKDGAAETLVMLGIINTADATCVSGAGDPVTHPTERFVAFMDQFGDRGLTGNICESSYVDFFVDAVALIDSTCDDFVPVG